MDTYAHPEVLVDGAWLADHLDDPLVKVVEVDLDPSKYEEGHIPGAVFWHGITDLLDPGYRTAFDPGSIGALLGGAGISPDSTVVAYSDHPALAAWVFWLLGTIGHRDTRVFQGGRARWLAEGRPLTGDLPSADPCSYEVAPPSAKWRADIDDVRAAVGDDRVVLLDVRTDEEHQGDIFVVAPPENDERGGHIPGAVHLFYQHTVREDGTFKSPAELRELFEAHGVTPEHTVITYCAVGMRSAHVWFVLSQLLGWPHVTSYDGSWNQWGRLPDTPVER